MRRRGRCFRHSVAPTGGAAHSAPPNPRTARASLPRVLRRAKAPPAPAAASSGRCAGPGHRQAAATAKAAPRRHRRGVRRQTVHQSTPLPERRSRAQGPPKQQERRAGLQRPLAPGSSSRSSLLAVAGQEEEAEVALQELLEVILHLCRPLAFCNFLNDALKVWKRRGDLGLPCHSPNVPVGIPALVVVLDNLPPLGRHVDPDCAVALGLAGHGERGRLVEADPAEAQATVCQTFSMSSVRASPAAWIALPDAGPLFAISVADAGPWFAISLADAGPWIALPAAGPWLALPAASHCSAPTELLTAEKLTGHLSA